MCGNELGLALQETRAWNPETTKKQTISVFNFQGIFAPGGIFLITDLPINTGIGRYFAGNL
jgi:hypothetical protein